MCLVKVGVWPSQPSCKWWRLWDVLWAFGAVQKSLSQAQALELELGRACSMLSLSPFLSLSLCTQTEPSTSLLQVPAGKSFWLLGWEGGRCIKTKSSSFYMSQDDKIRLLQLPAGLQWRTISASKRREQTHNGVFIWVSFSVSGQWAHLWDDDTNGCTISSNWEQKGQFIQKDEVMFPPCKHFLVWFKMRQSHKVTEKCCSSDGHTKLPLLYRQQLLNATVTTWCLI